jgi:hypothetical protein
MSKKRRRYLAYSPMSPGRKDWKAKHGSRWSPYGACDYEWKAPKVVRPVLLSELPATGRVFVRDAANPVAIYVLIDPRTEEIRYIGKTTQRSDIRLRQHLEKPTNRNMRQWFMALGFDGQAPKIRLITCCPHASWEREESRWIRWARELGARLLNYDPGGECRKHGGKLNTYGQVKRTISRRDGIRFRAIAAQDLYRRTHGQKSR